MEVLHQLEGEPGDHQPGRHEQVHQDSEVSSHYNLQRGPQHAGGGQDSARGVSVLARKWRERKKEKYQEQRPISERIFSIEKLITRYPHLSYRVIFKYSVKVSCH